MARFLHSRWHFGQRTAMRRAYRTRAVPRRISPLPHPLGDPVRAGAGLGVHENTVRYRLRKMAELTTLELGDARKRLAMMIELASRDT